MPGVIARLAACAAIIAIVLLCQPRRDAPAIRVGVPLNLRAGPDARAERLGRLPAGAAVTVDTCLSDRSWCRVRHGQQAGWASADYLTAATGQGRVRVADSAHVLRLHTEPGSNAH